MEYIVAVNKYRHFVTASEQCGVTQPTLSTMIQKLEEELNTKIFDRTKHPVEPTLMGIRIIKQAEVALAEIKKIKEMISNETGSLEGTLRIGIIPTLAPYIVPDFIHFFHESYPQVELFITEGRTQSLKSDLHKGFIDIMIAATPLEEKDFLEIPLYYEKFIAYFSDTKLIDGCCLAADQMPVQDLWVLQEGHCMRNQTFNFCKNFSSYNKMFEAGSIDTLIRIVDKNGGYSVIPELHIPYLTPEQQKKIKSIDNPPATREISLVIRNDFIKERLLNAVADTIKKIIPQEMLDARLKKFSIRL